jgi:hypothetical protein
MKNKVLYSWIKYSLNDYFDCLKREGVSEYHWGLADDQTESLSGLIDQEEVDKHHIVTFRCLNSKDYGDYMIGETDGELTCYCC